MGTLMVSQLRRRRTWSHQHIRTKTFICTLELLLSYIFQFHPLRRQTGSRSSTPNCCLVAFFKVRQRVCWSLFFFPFTQSLVFKRSTHPHPHHTNNTYLLLNMQLLICQDRANLWTSLENTWTGFKIFQKLIRGQWIAYHVKFSTF